MSKSILILLCTVFSLAGQNNQDTIYIKYSETNPKNKTIKTDSSIIEIKFFPDFGYIGEFNRLKKRDKIYYRQYDFTTRQLTEKGVWEDGYCRGLWKHYTNKGIPLWTINYDDGVIFEQMGYFPFKSYREFIKDKADSFVITNFGLNFFQTNIRWNPSQSYFGGNSRPGHWFEVAYTKPKNFILRYDVVLDNIKYSTIEFKLDSLGNLIQIIPEEVKGIRKCMDPSNNCMFNITMEQARAIAIQNGMKLKENKHLIYLSYNPEIKHGGYGDYELIVADYVRTEKKSNSTTNYYDGLVIDPWTGLLKERVQFSQLTLIRSHSSLRMGLKKIQ